jgi:hypothetical protein
MSVTMLKDKLCLVGVKPLECETIMLGLWKAEPSNDGRFFSAVLLKEENFFFFFRHNSFLRITISDQY